MEIHSSVKKAVPRPETSTTDRNSFCFPEFQESSLKANKEVFEVVNLDIDEESGSDETVTVAAPVEDTRPILMFFDVHIGR